MYSKGEKAIIFIDGFINLEYKHKRAIIDLYDDISTFFDYPELALDFLKDNLGENACNIFKLSLNEKFINELFTKYQTRGITIVPREVIVVGRENATVLRKVSLAQMKQT